MARLITVLALCAALVGCSSPGGTPASGGSRSSPSPSAGAERTAAPSRTPEATPAPVPSVEAPTATPRVTFGHAPTGPTELATVVEVTDGDTIKVDIGGSVYRVRYIGVDTPEIYSGIEPMGPEAADANAELVAGRDVVLEKDVSETDRFGRLLRYVWLREGDGWLLVNLELLRRGFAQVATYPPDVKYVDPLYLPAQQEARNAGAGLWAEAPAAAPAETPLVSSSPPTLGGGCDTSYPDVCIPPYPPDLDCGDISFRRFEVVAPDLHGFDGDHDGVGCEG